MKLTLKKIDVVRCLNGIVGIINLNISYPGDFVYFLSKNRRILEPEAKDIIEAENVILNEYNAKCKELKVGSAGVPVPPTVQEEFKDALDANTKFLEETIEIDLHTREYSDKINIPATYGDWIFPLFTEKKKED